MNQIFNTDCLTGLRTLPAESVHCCVTSPPYFGLRDYGMDGQIGMEETPAAFVQSLVEVFAEVWRVLRPDGTVWLNLGDSYANDGKWGGHTGGKHANALHCSPIGRNKRYTGLKPKDLIGIPWRVAFALQEFGWYLRQDIIWAKPNPMPESVTDRCTKSHEYIFLLSKSERYYFDAAAIAEDAAKGAAGSEFHTGKTGEHQLGRASKQPRQFGATKQEGTFRGDVGRTFIDNGKRNKRDVWTVSTKPFSEAHFATFPEDLIAPCILAGCPIDGLVLDPFMGAGTTALVARKLNRNYVGFELNPEYCALANRRLHSTLGMFV